ncbi:MAG: 1-deoxy-D-xylulose-5-phosphate synthase, partial [Eubacterium sp.]|nr:1-deoxy-D-xylulose-5-phosphate synthase [Eubacterium sp.]
PDDVKKLNVHELEALAAEMRGALITRLSKHGGHFGPNLGFVDATVALHYVFNSPKDKIVFDVSHQCYPHKMLTGRKDAYLYEDKFDEVSGYSNPDESEHDFFTIGHTSTSVSLAAGLAKGRDLTGGSENIIAVIGDGSLSGGEALEGLDFSGEQSTNMIVVINDNDMSIAENHGGIYKNLKELRESGGKCECNLFRAMGLDYRFVADGNDIKSLINAFEEVKDIDHPVAVHIVTEKGKGYEIAENSKENWHFCSPFDIETGKPKFEDNSENYNDLTADFLLDKMKKDSSVVAIASAVPASMGFTEEKRKLAGKQFVDVGIAEEHAVALASGIAKNGGKPVYGTFSTFIQRTYDQISQDLCINGNAATILVFWASAFGMNDVTHLGIYDIAMLSNIPNLVYLAPVSRQEYFAMLDWSIEQKDYPVAIRVPMNIIEADEDVDTDYGTLNRYKIMKKGEKAAIIALGSFYQLGEQAAQLLEERLGCEVTLINPRYITGTDDELLEELKKNHSVVATIEDGILNGGFGEKIARFYGADDMKVLNFGIEKAFYDRYNPQELLEENHLTPKQIADDILAVL